MEQHQAHPSKACSSCEFILDIHFAGDITHIWTKTGDGSTQHYPLFYHPLIYVAADDDADQYVGNDNRSLQQLLPLVRAHPQIVSAEIVSRYLSSGDDQTHKVIELQVYSPHVLDEVIADFKARNLNMFNIDLNIRQQFFVDTKSSPMMACHIYRRSPDVLPDYIIPEDAVELDRISVHGDPISISYPLPKLRLLDLSLEIGQAGTFATYDDRLLAIELTTRTFGQETDPKVERLEGRERFILLKLVETIRTYDPDFLNIVKGDKFVLNYLAHRAAHHQLSHLFVLGRLSIPTYPRKETEGQTYMSYGQIMRREQVWYIPGRVHVDAANSFFMYEAGLAGLIDLARMAGVPPERTARSSIGTALTGIEFKVNAATFPPTLVPPSKSTGEQFKPADHLLISDNGGLIYPARPGVYDRVWAIDFTSLYPMIMAIHNIGNETVLCDHESCKGEIIVPEVNYHVCKRKVGVVPRTMYLVLQKRLLLKMSKKNARASLVRERFKGIDSAMKWILVSCFGYLGFKNARWGSIESHQCVTAYARRYLQQARQICEDFGFEVVAGITDSLFVRARDPADDTRQVMEELVKEVTRQSSIPLDIEGRFNWVVFGGVKEYDAVAALNRYFGYFDHEEFKLRGIKHRQRRALTLELEFQEDLLDHFKAATTVGEFFELIPASHKILEDYVQRLQQRKISATDLVMKLKTGRGSSGYRATSTVQALATKRYETLGHALHPGMNFFFVVVDNQRRDIDRVRIGPEIDDDTEYDPDYYIDLLNRDYLEITEDAQKMAYDKVKYDVEGVTRGLDEFVEETELNAGSSGFSQYLKKGKQCDLDQYF